MVTPSQGILHPYWEQWGTYLFNITLQMLTMTEEGKIIPQCSRFFNVDHQTRNGQKVAISKCNL